MPETITVCPDCGSARIKRNSTRQPETPDYRCKGCQQRFEEPATREKRHPGGATGGSEWVASLMEAGADD